MITPDALPLWFAIPAAASLVAAWFFVEIRALDREDSRTD